MKKLTKVAILAICAVALVAASVLGTLAYLKATTDVAINTFTIGNITLSLDEAKVDEYGVPVAGADRVLANEYKLIPAHTYTKDPTVTVGKGSEPCYVRMIVTITDIEDVKAAFGDDFLPQNFVNGTWDGNVWVSTNHITDNGNNTYSYEFRYKEIVDASEAEVKLPALFKEIKITENIASDKLENLSDMQIQVVAHAIQADGFTSADDAWSKWN